LLPGIDTLETNQVRLLTQVDLILALINEIITLNLIVVPIAMLLVSITFIRVHRSNHLRLRDVLRFNSIHVDSLLYLLVQDNDLGFGFVLFFLCFGKLWVSENLFFADFDIVRARFGCSLFLMHVLLALIAVDVHLREVNKDQFS
jgi:hypothetical protein